MRHGNDSKSSRALVRFSILFLLIGLAPLGVAVPAAALETKDLAGFWKGTLLEMYEKDKVSGKLPATLDIIERKDGTYDAYFGPSIFFCRLRNFEVSGDKVSFHWIVGENDNKIETTVQNGNTMSFELTFSPNNPRIRVALIKDNSKQLADADLVGRYQGRAEAGSGMPEDRKKILTDCTLDLFISGDGVSAKFRGQPVPQEGSKEKPKALDIPIRRIERHGNRLFMFEQDDENAMKQESILDCLIATIKPGGVDISYVFPRLGNGFGTLSRSGPVPGS